MNNIIYTKIMTWKNIIFRFYIMFHYYFFPFYNINEPKLLTHLQHSKFSNACGVCQKLLNVGKKKAHSQGIDLCTHIRITYKFYRNFLHLRISHHIIICPRSPYIVDVLCINVDYKKNPKCQISYMHFIWNCFIIWWATVCVIWAITQIL